MAIRVNYVRRQHGLTIYIEGYECQLIIPMRIPSSLVDEFIDAYVTPTEADLVELTLPIYEAIGDEFDTLLEKVHNFGVLEIPEHLRAPLAELKEKVVEIQVKLQGKEAPKEKA